MGRTRELIRRSAIVLLVLSGGACRSYSPIVLPGPDAPARSLGAYSRVTTKSDEVYHLANASIEGDSIIGSEEVSGRRTAIAVADVGRVEIWKFSPGRSVAFAGGYVLVVVILAAGLLFALVGLGS